MADIYLQDYDLDWLHSQKMSKEGNMESKKRLMYVNPTITSDTHVAFSWCSPSACSFLLMFSFSILEAYILAAICFMLSKICSLSL